MTKTEEERIALKSAIVEQLLDKLNYEDMRGMYIAMLQIVKDQKRGDVQTVAFEIDAAAYTEEKKSAVKKIVRLCFLMDEKNLHRLYITALNML